MAERDPMARTASPRPLERGRAAYQARAWSDAYGSLSAADRMQPLGSQDLWRLATSAYLIGREDEFLAALERAHHSHLEAGEPARAARCAFWIGMRLGARGDTAQATGWLGRAGRLLEREPGDCVERGYMRVADAYRHLTAGDHDSAHGCASAAIEIGERFADADLLSLAVHLQGLALLMQARVDDGLALLDEAMVAVAAGELSPQVTGLIYCSVIGACRRVYALERAHEWTAALMDWCEQQPDLVAYSGECLAYRAEILQLQGAWREAIEEAGRACDRLADTVERRSAALAHYLRAEVHRLRGEFAAAEAGYREASRRGWQPQPGRALLRLGQGDTVAAAAAIRRVLAETADRLQRARLLPAQIEIMLAAGSTDDARAACDELDETARTYRSSVLATMVAHGRGATMLAQADAAGALVWLRHAARGWQAIEAPYETARVGVLLGLACRELGDDDAASLELETARETFSRLGAGPDVARVDTLMHRSSTRPAHGLTPRELDVLALVATGRTNRAVAHDLHISEKTVARHVSNIFTKLGLSSRAAATAWAYEHDVV